MFVDVKFYIWGFYEISFPIAGFTPFGQKPLGRQTLPSNNTMPLLFGSGLSGWQASFPKCWPNVFQPNGHRQKDVVPSNVAIYKHLQTLSQIPHLYYLN